MGESFAEFIAAERALERQGWARADAARLPVAELASVDVFELRDEVADCHANQQPTTAALLAAIVDRAVAWQAARLRPPSRLGGRSDDRHSRSHPLLGRARL
jgi:hypothetical protein